MSDKKSVVRKALDSAESTIKYSLNAALKDYFRHLYEEVYKFREGINTDKDPAAVRAAVLDARARFGIIMELYNKQLDAAVAEFDVDATELAAWNTAEYAGDRVARAAK